MAKDETKTTNKTTGSGKKRGPKKGPRKMRPAVLLGHVLDYMDETSDLNITTASMEDFKTRLEVSILADVTPRRTV